MKKFSAGVIGCGRIGCGFDDGKRKKSTHAGAYNENKNINLEVLCDIDRKKLEKYGKKYGVKNLFEKFDKSIKNINIISICTVADTHLEIVREASKTDIKAIFLEKPISDNLKDAKRIIEICKSQQIHLLIDHQRRFDPFYQKIKGMIEQGIFGKIQLVTIVYGAGIANTGTHIFDLIRYFFGNVKTVDAKFSNNISHNVKDPNLDVELKLKDEIAVKIHALDVSHYGMLEMNIFGTKSRLTIDLAANKLKYYKVAKTGLVYKQLKKSKIHIKHSKQSSIMYGLENLLKCVTENQNPLCTGEDGYKALELTIAAMTSAKNKQKILLSTKN
jgi:predicted dehydrogenase